VPVSASGGSGQINLSSRQQRLSVFAEGSPAVCGQANDQVASPEADCMRSLPQSSNKL
jgi:hypothetical protein